MLTNSFTCVGMYRFQQQRFKNRHKHTHTPTQTHTHTHTPTQTHTHTHAHSLYLIHAYYLAYKHNISQTHTHTNVSPGNGTEEKVCEKGMVLKEDLTELTEAA